MSITGLFSFNLILHSSAEKASYDAHIILAVTAFTIREVFDIILIEAV
jgi:hypothetical protein